MIVSLQATSKWWPIGHLVPGVKMNAQISLASQDLRAAGPKGQAALGRGPKQASAFTSFTWRAFDVLVASAILIVTLPFLLLLAAVMWASDPGPLFFVHRRIGLRGRSFGCIKFRTMRLGGDQILQDHLSRSPAALREWMETHKLKNDPRVTRLGGLVRKLSLDEFPQLINILKGEMSIVGPRPIVEAEVERYGRYFEFYTHVRPGLTGLWQISGRSDTSYRERVELDVEYIGRKSLMLDTWLLVKTVPAVLLARGSY